MSKMKRIVYNQAEASNEKKKKSTYITKFPLLFISFSPSFSFVIDVVVLQYIFWVACIAWFLFVLFQVLPSYRHLSRRAAIFYFPAGFWYWCCCDFCMCVCVCVLFSAISLVVCQHKVCILYIHFLKRNI